LPAAFAAPLAANLVDVRREMAVIYEGVYATMPVPVLLVYVYDLAAPGDVDDAFMWSGIMTGVAFAVVGGMKSRFVDQAWWRSALETVAVGSLAAALGYSAGSVPESVA
jgi:VIT1/CCC1 family predicted Fe2+/Mn2+ transporter